MTMMIPNAEAQKRKTRAAAEAIAGMSAGSVTVRKARAGLARAGDGLEVVAIETMRRPATSPPSATQATPTTTVGRTNGTVTRARARLRPGKRTAYNK